MYMKVFYRDRRKYVVYLRVSVTCGRNFAFTYTMSMTELFCRPHLVVYKISDVWRSAVLRFILRRRRQ